MKLRCFGIIPVILMLVFVSGCVSSAQDEVSVSKFLSAPVYDMDVAVSGEVNNLGEMFCPCFTLTHDGSSVDVWYDLMVDGDIKWPSVGMSGIENGDKVIVFGQLRSVNGSMPSATFWAKSVIKADIVIGGEKDEHGCLVAAGYTWCENKGKCLRTWEEPCVTNFEECIAEGNPVMESYPRQCSAPDGTTFTEELYDLSGCNQSCIESGFSVGHCMEPAEICEDDVESGGCFVPGSDDCDIAGKCKCYCKHENGTGRTKIANPASVYCEEQGGTIIFHETSGGIAGYCDIKGKVCEEWEYFMSEGTTCNEMGV